ncbi:exodeoxyribonuclease V subunit alpha [Eleftheria terrae]|uniref:exodeoxyribonuclease V subunit alpha n=1 Tax=Eleftheria terrae TaxID=1597781 RepID=UPI00263B0AC2|nr:exodeoxyribonuclease V subunit alpha [Eleftheria terrae]WKB53088.1 exodeoxyribonuclease V subunit alpha [Eleftheria terrae]
MMKDDHLPSRQPASGGREALLQQLGDWSERGWLRRLDAAFARFVAQLAPQAPEPVLLAAALLAHLEGRGHACLDLGELLSAPDALLGWPPPATQALQAVLDGLPATAAPWLGALRQCELVAGADGGQGQEPLVLADGRLYLRRYWRYEQRIAAEVARRVAEPLPVDTARARHWLDRLFDAAEPRPDDAVDWQKAACAVALRGRLSIITGGPGTGKTYTVARLLALLHAMQPAGQQLRVALAAPTGKAAARLRQSIEDVLQALQPALAAELPGLAAYTARLGAARTLHALLGVLPDTRRFRHDAAHPLEVDVLVVDEASMVHLEMMSALLDALPPATRLVLLGDKDQLASVEAGSVLGDLCRGAEAGRYDAATRDYLLQAGGQALPARWLGAGTPLAQQTVMLRESRRFGGPLGRLAQAVNAGDVAQAAAVLRSGGEGALGWQEQASPQAVVQLALQGRPGAPGGYRAYLERLHERPPAGDAAAHEAWARAVLDAFDRFRVLCALREGEWGVAGLNQAIEAALVEARWLARRGEWYEGRPVMVTRNDATLGVFNGDVGIALRPFGAAGAALRVYFKDGERLRSVLVSRLADVETAFAMTVHKSQGSEFAHTVLALPEDDKGMLTRELVYTGITRARAALSLLTARPAGFEAALGRTTRRGSGLAPAIEALQRRPGPPAAAAPLAGGAGPTLGSCGAAASPGGPAESSSLDEAAAPADGPPAPAAGGGAEAPGGAPAPWTQGSLW